MQREVEGLPDTDVIDMGNWICPDAVACAPVVGHVTVYRDAHHFTETYAKTLAQPLDAELRQSPVAAGALW